jgi:Rieske [2Fe-2S] domain
VDHRCPHRCASLFLGRNEANGIRCVYHGWKFDVEGKCVDMPSVPPHQDFKHKVRAKAYMVVERAGLVWVFMGAPAAAPPMPALEVLLMPGDEVGVRCIQRDCNYLQALEGDIDTSHFAFLHAGHVDPDDVTEDHPIRHTVTNRAPRRRCSLGHAVRGLPLRRSGPHELAIRQLPFSILESNEDRKLPSENLVDPEASAVKSPGIFTRSGYSLLYQQSAATFCSGASRHAERKRGAIRGTGTPSMSHDASTCRTLMMYPA